MDMISFIYQNKILLLFLPNTTETVKYYEVQLPKESTFTSNQLSYFKNTHLFEIIIHNLSKFGL